MSSLQSRMAEHGFESNDDYGYHVRCLLAARTSGIRCLNIQGESNRRKTAFASALANALGYPHILYHDFTQKSEPQPPVILPKTQDEFGREEPPIAPLDRIVSEACAFSEGEGTILILDQLQAADFREHIRLYKFLKTAEWRYRETIFYANKRYLLIFIISETPIYHSLQKSSFRIWVSSVSHRQVHYQPSDFGLPEDAGKLMESLARLFEALGTAPTHSEYERLLHDLHYNVRTANCLRHSLYGWVEGVDRGALFAKEFEPVLDQVMSALRDYVGVQEVEVTGIVE